MKMGVGFSREKDPEVALAEAYRKSLQKLKATKADLCLIFYSYDYALEAPLFSGALKRVFREIPVHGASTWSAWGAQEGFESETALMVVSFKDPSFQVQALKIHSLREKAELWATELSRQLESQLPNFVCVLADSLNFTAGSGFSVLERKFPHIPFVGVGTSFGVPQCSVVASAEVHINTLLALSFSGDASPVVALMQNVRPELKEVAINRMSENLVIEIDSKPAFYKLCEHLMVQDDLPMMAPDEFRKQMGNLYVVEKGRENYSRAGIVGEPYKSISLLGSEMTTGMVAVAQTLDFSQSHFLGQKKGDYAEAEMLQNLSSLKVQIPNPSCLWLLSNSARIRDKDRKKGDLEIVKSVFPDAPIFGLATNGEYVNVLNQFAALVIAFG